MAAAPERILRNVLAGTLSGRAAAIPEDSTKRGFRRTVLVSIAAALTSAILTAQPVEVRRLEGLVHGFLTLRTLDGTLLADGEWTQVLRGDRVHARLTFRFADGSRHDESTVFTQRGTFRLVSERLVQSGPSFPHPIDLTIDAASGRVSVRYAEKGTEKVDSETLDLPSNLANGMLFTLLKNLRPGAARTELSLVAANPKPRLVKLHVAPGGEEGFTAGGRRYSATKYVVKIEIPGVAGAVAPLVGKQPPDTSVWILGGDAPAFVKSEGPLASDAPPWRVELASPAWSGPPARE